MGLIHITTQSWSSSIIVFDNVFTSDYENYYCLITTTHSTGTNISNRWRANGVNEQTSNSYRSRNAYFYATTYGTSGVVTGDAGLCGLAYTSAPCLNEIYIYSPAISVPTALRCTVGYDTASQESGIGIYGQTNDRNTSYDGVVFYASSGTFSGEVSIYGIKNS